MRLPTVGDMLDTVLSNPPSDPLYVLLLRPWMALFGHSDAAIRSLSVIFSVATLGAVYWLGRVLFNHAAGLLAALFVALSPYAVEFGQEAALYALASLTITLTLAAGWRWRKTGSKRDRRVYVMLGVVAVCSHYVAVAILALFVVLGFMRWAGPHAVSVRAWVLGHAVIFAAWLPWLIALAIHWLNADLPRATLRHPAILSEIGGALTQFSSGTSALLRGVRPLEWAGLIVGGAFLALGWMASSTLERRGLRLILALSAVIFFTPALVSSATGLWLFVPHFMLFLLPALFVVTAGGLLAVGAVGKERGSTGEEFTHHAPHIALRVGNSAISRADTILPPPTALRGRSARAYRCVEERITVGGRGVHNPAHPDPHPAPVLRRPFTRAAHRLRLTGGLFTIRAGRMASWPHIWLQCSGSRL